MKKTMVASSRNLKVISAFRAYIKLVLNHPSHTLSLTRRDELLTMTRPLSRAWYAIEDQMYSFRFKSDITRLITGLIFNITSLTILLTKIRFNIKLDLWLTVIQLSLSLFGVLFVVSGLGLRYKVRDDRALMYIKRYAPHLYEKIIEQRSLLSHYDPSIVLNYYSPNTLGFPSDFTEEIAGLIAIGGIGTTPVAWIAREETLFEFCGLSEYVHNRLQSNEHLDNFHTLKYSFIGSVDELIAVSRKL